MTTFRCEDPGRRRRLLEQSAPPGSRIDAIDYVVVADGLAVPDSIRQRVLLVRTVFGDHMGALGPDVVRITGGVRVRDPIVTWAMPMPDVVAPGGPADDPAMEPDPLARAWLAARVAATPDAAQWLVVRVAEPGDYSRYTLRLASASGTPVPGFDRRLAEVELSFKVECPATDDCGATDECAVQPVVAPEIDYLARDFPSFRRLLFDRLSLLQPGEDDRGAAQLRTTLVELLAWGADRVAYQQDAVATEAYLGTARLRRSVRRHARLLDYPMHEGCNARAFVHLQIAGPGGVGSAAAPAVPVGAQFWTRVPDLIDDTTLEALPWIDAVLARKVGTPPVVFEAIAPLVRASSVHDEIAIHVWGDTDCCLAAGSTAITVVDPGALELAPGDFVLLEEIAWTPAVDDTPRRDPDRTHRQIVRLTAVSAPYPDELVGVDVRDLEWALADALRFDLPLAAPDGRTVVVRGNMVLVDQGAVAHEDDVAVQSFGRRGRVAVLERTGMVWREPVPTTIDTPAAVMVAQDPRRAMPAIELTDPDGAQWTPRRDLLGSAGSALDFVVEMESDGRAHLRFGDDRLGRAPISATFAHARYRVGNGTTGNVGAESIVHAAADPDRPDAFPLTTAQKIAAVRNPLPAEGGSAPEPIDDVRLYAPRAFRRQERAVTVADWAEITQRDPEIQRAVARIEWTGSWATVFVHIDPRDGRPVDDDLRARQLARLDRYRLAGYDLEIVAPQHVAVDLAATVCVAPGFGRDDVQRRLRREFATGRLPDGRRGFFHPDEFTFGQSLFLSRVVARMMAVPGVREVDFTPPKISTEPQRRFKRWGRSQGAEV
ncbi:MAG TPA: putative baseplate assembly protein, partial [Nannocystaceae bacterium]|nr:putative baseplate assembly protein [Nannocystaceae bacterium]